MESSIAPSDSVSAANSRKSKPGKAERAARRAATGSVAGVPASTAKAMTFAAGVNTPKPQPGKFPIVFQTGAGEPSRDKTFTIGPKALATSLASFPPAFQEHMRYAEFLSYSSYDDDDFTKQLVIAGLLRLAQQLVHCHVNIGLPQGDFGPVATTEVRVPASMAAFLSQYGEHSVPALGTRFLFRDYVNQVKATVWAARCVHNEPRDEIMHILARSWLPMSASDGHTKQHIADALNNMLRNADIQYQSADLETAVLSGNVPSTWDEIKPLFGANPDRYDFLFKSYQTAPLFYTAFTSAANLPVLTGIGLPWANPQASHLDWSFNVKEKFIELSNDWALKSVTYASFFEMPSSLANRHAAAGSQSQMALVTVNDSVTVVKTHLALSAPEFSLVACFPVSGVYADGLVRNVVLTTPLSVTQRATEFIQMDWR